jgi:hypothetical protein
MSFKQLILSVLFTCCLSSCANNHTYIDSSTYEETSGNFIVKIKGQKEEITYSEDFGLITFLPTGSSINLDTRGENGDKITVIVEAHPTKGAKYQLNTQSNKQSENNAKELFRAASQDFFRKTSFASIARSEHLYRLGGTASLISEIEHLATGFVTYTYLKYWIEQYSFDPQQLTNIIGKTAAISSDSDLGELLIALSTNQKLNTNHYNQLLDVSRNIDSDNEMRKLYTLLSNQPIVPEVKNKLIQYAGYGISSDAELSKTLISVINHGNFDKEVWTTWFKAASTIDSDNQLSALIKKTPIPSDQQVIIKLIDLAVSGIDSDSELAFTLVYLAKHSLDESSEAALSNAAKNLNSDGERAKVLLALSEFN